MSWAWKQRLGWTAGGVVLGLVAMPLIASAVLNRITPSVEDPLRERGLPVTLEEWDAWHHDDPDAPNAAALYQEAAALRDEAPGDAYALLVEAAGYDYCRFPLEISDWREEDGSFRPAARELSRLLEGRARDALARGDGTAVLEALEAMLALAHAMRQQPRFLDYLTASGIAHLAVYEILPEAFSEGLLNEAGIDALEARLAPLEPPGHAHRALLGTMAFWIRNASPETEWRDAPAPVGWFWGLLNLPERVRTVYAKDHLRIHDMLHLPYAEQLDAVEAWEYSSDAVIDLFDRVSRSPYRVAMISSPEYFVHGLAVSEGRFAAARAGLMVERYRLAHGRLPESAEALAQAGIALPDDPLGMGAIRYALDNGGYRVWSAGLDMLDDGGIEGRGGQPDLVFRVPPPNHSTED